MIFHFIKNAVLKRIINTFYVHLNKEYLHSTLSIVVSVIGGRLLFVALHSSIFLSSDLFPVKSMEVVLLLALLVMSVDPRYQAMVGAGKALLLHTHLISIWVSILIVRVRSLGIRDTLSTSTVFVWTKNMTFTSKLFTTSPMLCFNIKINLLNVQCTTMQTVNVIKWWRGGGYLLINIK